MSERTTPYEVLAISPNERRDEQLGTKYKFWFDLSEQRTLFKRGRANEDWTEKVASGCASLLGLPHAQVELATCDEQPGIVSPSFLQPSDKLVHGNEILFGADPAYPKTQRFHLREHTLDAVFAVLERYDVRPGVPGLPTELDARDLFTGYLILDAWIGNSDRHHENWAVIDREGSQLLAPTYDHASSMGRNETPERIRLRLVGGDPRMTVDAYATRCRSALYESPQDTKPMNTYEAARKAMERRPAARAYWLGKLAQVPDSRIEELFQKIPASRAAEMQRAFALEILRFNRKRLLTETP